LPEISEECCENHSCTNCSGNFRNCAVAFEGQLKGDRSRYVSLLKPEVCTAGVSKITKKSNGKVMDRKENRFLLLGNLLLSGSMTLAAATRT